MRYVEVVSTKSWFCDQKSMQAPLWKTIYNGKKNYLRIMKKRLAFKPSIELLDDHFENSNFDPLIHHYLQTIDTTHMINKNRHCYSFSIVVKNSGLLSLFTGRILIFRKCLFMLPELPICRRLTQVTETDICLIHCSQLLWVFQRK